MHACMHCVYDVHATQFTLYTLELFGIRVYYSSSSPTVLMDS